MGADDETVEIPLPEFFTGLTLSAATIELAIEALKELRDTPQLIHTFRSQVVQAIEEITNARRASRTLAAQRGSSPAPRATGIVE